MSACVAKKAAKSRKIPFCSPDPDKCFYWLAKLKMLCTDFQRRIRGRRRFEQHANFSLFCRFLRRHPGAQAAAKIHFYTREVVLCRKNDIQQAFKRKFIGDWGQRGAKGKIVSLLWAACTAAAANVTNDSFT